MSITIKDLKQYIAEHKIELPKDVTDKDLYDIIKTTEGLAEKIEKRREQHRNQMRKVSLPV